MDVKGVLAEFLDFKISDADIMEYLFDDCNTDPT